MQSGEGESDDGKSEEEHDEDGIAPDPPVAFLDLQKLTGQVLIRCLPGRGNWAGLGVSHRVEVKVANSVVSLS